MIGSSSLPIYRKIPNYESSDNVKLTCFLFPKDLKSVIYKTANFIGKDMNNDEVEKLLVHLSFSNMKKNSAVNSEPFVEARKKLDPSVKDIYFTRRGVVGDWKEAMDPELYERFEKWERKNLNGINFTYSV